MKFLRGIVHSGLIGTPSEKAVVSRVLTLDSKRGSFLGRSKVISARDMLYSGLIDFVREQLPEHTIEEEYTYPRPELPLGSVKIPRDYIKNDDPDYQDREYQRVAVRKALYRQRGILELATGAGKSEIMIMISKYLLEHNLVEKIYVITGTRFLMKQAAARFEKRGLTGIGRLGGGFKFKPATIQCCVVDSLRTALEDATIYGGDNAIAEDFGTCDCIFFDECHHLAADSWVQLGESCPAIWRYGLTATAWSNPFEYSHSDMYLMGLTGGVIVNVPSKVLRRRGYLADPVVTMFSANKPVVSPRVRQWDNVYEEGIVKHSLRNSTILSLSQSLYEGEYKTLVFVGRINHGLLLVKHLVEMGCRNTYFVKGGELIYTWKPSGRWDINKITIGELSEQIRDEKNIVLVGTSVVDEGVDFPEVNALVMGTAMKKYRRSIQRAGRGMRPKEGDNKVYIFDFIDSMHPTLLHHSEYRIKTYELEEYEFSTSLEKTSELMGVPLSVEPGLYNYEWVKPSRKRRRRSAS